MTGCDRPTRVFFPCTGLGRQRRGFETFTRECAAAIRGDPRVDVTVFGGGGPFAAPGERAVPNFPRDAAITRIISTLVSREPYFIEQASFFAGFLPALAAGRPDVVYFADLNLGNACWHWRRISGQRFRLLFYNGGATNMPFTRSDLVQQVSPEHLADAIARGESAERQVLLPHAVNVPAAFSPPSAAERAQIRSALGIPVDRQVLLSVGMLDATVKRMDYVIREVASLGNQRPYLVLAGANSPETPAILALARDLLGDDGFVARGLPPDQMPQLYRAADAFVLATFREAFGLAIAEALAAGLSCVLHDTQTSAYIAGPHARYANLRTSGAAAPLLAAALADAGKPADMLARHAWVRERFSWDVLRERHVELLVACANGVRPAWADHVS